MLYLGDRLPAEPGRVLNGVDLGLGSAVEDGVEPVVPLEALRGFKLVGRKPDLFDRGPALDLDEPISMAVFGSSGCGLREMRSKPRSSCSTLSTCQPRASS